MDSRNIKEQPDFANKDYLDSIFTLQKSLLDKYMGIEKLPNYPLNINTKASQTLLKDFTSRVIEELAEAFEAILFVNDITTTNHFWLDTQWGLDSPSQYQAMLNHLQNVGEEMADALHFYIELFIYANIGSEDIVRWCKQHSNYRDDFSEQDIHNIKIFGASILHEEYDLRNLFSHNSINLLNPLNKEFPGVNLDMGEEIEYIICGSKISLEHISNYKKILWDITYHLNISRNFLKNKPWKQSQVMSSESAYQEQLVIGFVKFMGLLHLMGCSERVIYFIYYKKNKVNEFRIKSNY